MDRAVMLSRRDEAVHRTFLHDPPRIDLLCKDNVPIDESRIAGSHDAKMADRDSSFEPNRRNRTCLRHGFILCLERKDAALQQIKTLLTQLLL